MFEIGEYIVHPGQGVCRIADIVDDPDPTYKLIPIGLRHPMLISYPVASEDRLRPVISCDEAQDLIDGYQDMQLDKHRARSRALEEKHFRSVIRTGTCKDTIRVAKTFRQRIDDVQAENKKPPVVYRRIFQEAKDRSLEELAVALDMTPEDVAHQLVLEDDELCDA